MDNFSIYKKTLKFSFLRILVLLAALLVGCAIVLLTYKLSDFDRETNVVIHVAGTSVGMLAFALIAHYAGYLWNTSMIAAWAGFL